MESIGFTEKHVKIVEIANWIANKNNFYKFIRTFPCLPTPFRPNTFIRFWLANVSKWPLTNLPLPLKPSTWASFLVKYPKSDGLRIHLQMILNFRAELGYDGPSNDFILSDNLTLAFQKLTIIEKKLQKDLISRRVILLQGPLTLLYICLSLGLVLKHNSGWQKIYHLSHPHGESINDHILDGAEELRYSRF